MLPRTTSRVERATSSAVNRQIAEELERTVRYYAERPEEIDGRLDELDREWDIERVLAANAASLALTGTLLGAYVDRRFLILPGLVTGFLLQHALQGWCPPVPVFRRMGVRTCSEIDRERYALKALRNDFAGVCETANSADPKTKARRALAAVST